MLNEVRLIGNLAADPEVIGKATKLTSYVYDSFQKKDVPVSFMLPTSFLEKSRGLVKGAKVLFLGKVGHQVKVVDGKNHHSTVVTINQVWSLEKAPPKKDETANDSDDDLSL